MSEPLVLRESTGATVRLVMNNPAKLNALSTDMLNALQAEVDDIANDDSVRAVILSGAGKAFCAGHDLREISAARQSPDKGAAELKALFDRCSKLMLSLQAMPQPVVAQAHGIATAAGCQLVATCDLAVAEETTRFGVNGVNIGLFCSTPMVALSRNIPPKKAFEMLTTGEFISADRAEDLGLINKVSSEASLAKDAEELAGKVASKLAGAVKIGKQAFYTQRHMSTADAYTYTGAVMVENMALDETDEGVKAFIEKRAPNWDQ